MKLIHVHLFYVLKLYYFYAICLLIYKLYFNTKNVKYPFNTK